MAEFVIGVLMLLALVYALKLGSRPLIAWSAICDRWFKNSRKIGFAVFVTPFVAVDAAAAYWISHQSGGGSWLSFPLWFLGFGVTLVVLVVFSFELGE